MKLGAAAVHRPPAAGHQSPAFPLLHLLDVLDAELLPPRCLLQVTASLPSEQSPTVSQLMEGQFVAVSALRLGGSVSFRLMLAHVMLTQLMMPTDQALWQHTPTRSTAAAAACACFVSFCSVAGTWASVPPTA